MRTTLNRSIAAIFMSLFGVGQSWAIPILSLDLDIFTSGSQISRDVNIGDNFTVAVLLSDYDSSTLIDTVSFDLNYNNNGAVLTGVGSPASGVLVDLSPTATWDGFAFSLTDINQGDLLTTLNFGAMAGFQANFGTFAYSSVTDPFLLTGSDPITVATYNFTASALGISALAMATNPVALSYQGNAVNLLLGGGVVNVVTAVPEPTIAMLFGLGLIGFFVSRSHIRQH